MDRWIDRQIDGQMDRWIDGQIDGQMDRWIDGQIDRNRPRNIQYLHERGSFDDAMLRTSPERQLAL